MGNHTLSRPLCFIVLKNLSGVSLFETMADPERARTIKLWLCWQIWGFLAMSRARKQYEHPSELLQSAYNTITTPLLRYSHDKDRHKVPHMPQ